MTSRHPAGGNRLRLMSQEKPHAALRIVFLVVAIIAAVLGFGGIAGTAAGIAKILFVVFIILFLASLIFGRRPKL